MEVVESRVSVLLSASCWWAIRKYENHLSEFQFLGAEAEVEVEVEAEAEDPTSAKPVPTPGKEEEDARVSPNSSGCDTARATDSAEVE